jgi:hypothetical protein
MTYQAARCYNKLGSNLQIPRLKNRKYRRSVYYYVRYEAFTVVTMKNVVFWDIKTQSVLHREHITRNNLTVTSSRSISSYSASVANYG